MLFLGRLSGKRARSAQRGLIGFSKPWKFCPRNCTRSCMLCFCQASTAPSGGVVSTLCILIHCQPERNSHRAQQGCMCPGDVRVCTGSWGVSQPRMNTVSLAAGFRFAFHDPCTDCLLASLVDLTVAALQGSLRGVQELASSNPMDLQTVQGHSRSCLVPSILLIRPAS